MPKVQITASDIQQLADRLAALEPEMSTNERVVLRTIFSLAAEAVGRSHPDIRVRRRPRKISAEFSTGGLGPESIRDLFDSTFTPSLASEQADSADPDRVIVKLKIGK